MSDTQPKQDAEDVAPTPRMFTAPPRPYRMRHVDTPPPAKRRERGEGDAEE